MTYMLKMYNKKIVCYFGYRDLLDGVFIEMFLIVSSIMTKKLYFHSFCLEACTFFNLFCQHMS